MASSSFSSDFSSSSSSPDTTTFPSTFPSSALAAARMRRHRRDAIALQAESEWDAQPSTTPFSTGWSWTDHPVPPTTTTPGGVPPAGDELICPLASLPSSSSTFAFPHVVDTSRPDQAHDGGDGDDDVDTELQATLARFAFPSTTRKHRRSGEPIDHHPTPPPSAVGVGATRRRGAGPVKRAQCEHCMNERESE